MAATDDYFSNYQSFIGAKPLPSPADTPYETPGLRSRRSSRSRRTPTRGPSNSPPPLPTDAAEWQDGKLSAMDPRHFTPTLHASLVSEILSLRRELDLKHGYIDGLEATLQREKAENELLAGKLQESTKESRLAQKQLNHVERGTLDAVEDLLRERDSAAIANEDLRSKMDALTKKARRQEEEALQSYNLWEREKQSWDNERRQLERRVHVTESRLRAFVEEMSMQQADNEKPDQNPDSGAEETFKDSGLGNESDTASLTSYRTLRRHRRNRSSLSLRSNPRSSHGFGSPAKGNVFSLADELKFDEEDEYHVAESDHEDDDLLYDRRARVLESRQPSHYGGADAKAKKILGLTCDSGDGVLGPESDVSKNNRRLSIFDGEVSKEKPSTSEAANSLSSEPVEDLQASRPSHQYVDRGIQPSPRSSIIFADGSKVMPEGGKDEAPEAHVHIIPEGLHIDTDVSASSKQTDVMVSVASQTAELPISPPSTPRIAAEEPTERFSSVQLPEYFSTSTQTDLPPPRAEVAEPVLRLPLPVPSIAIHPPVSTPPSPRNSTVLPPNTKSASSQTDWVLSQSTCDVSVQTEEIRIDRRPVKLPPHLLPSALVTVLSPRTDSVVDKSITESARAPRSPTLPTQESATYSSRTNSSRDLRSLPLKALPIPRPVLSPTEEKPPSVKEKGPVNRAVQYGVSNPMRSSTFLADLQDDSEDSDRYTEGFSDVEPRDLYGNTPSLARPVARSTYVGLPKTVPEDKEVSPGNGSHSTFRMEAASSEASELTYSTSIRERRVNGMHSSRSNQMRSRTPSVTSVGSSSMQSAKPPFPIPKRSSSRVLEQPQSEGSPSPTPCDGQSVTSRRTERAPASAPARRVPLRKVQSATAMRQNQTSPRRRRRAPQLTPIQSMAFESPAATRFPIPDLPASPRPPTFNNADNGDGHAADPITDAVHEDALADNAQDTSLVDAIAATMVGEWMWKYVRRRKSFGVSEHDFSKDDGGAHGVRHKRWVWLSPYERTIMWSTKQPVTGSALLGKSGRKLVIKSVLDVRDEGPLPKGATADEVFKRSILILTPARALKFTAPSRERHYLWLTALSFLAHPNRGPPQVPRVPAVPPQEADVAQHLQGGLLRRAPVRDSVRVAKIRASRPAPLKLADASALPEAPDMPLTAQTAVSDTTVTSAAEAPSIPRLYVQRGQHHARKRSNTGPAIPTPLHGFRSLSSSAAPPPSSHSHAKAALAPTVARAPSSFSGAPAAAASKPPSSSRRTSVASPDRPNFFEAVGTVRMEAFVEPGLQDGVLYVPAPPPGTVVQRRRRRGDSQLSVGTAEKRRAGYVFDEDGEDPFKGF